MKTANQQTRRLSPRELRELLADVERLAEAVADHVDRLHERGLGAMARPLERALDRLGG